MYLFDNDGDTTKALAEEREIQSIHDAMMALSDSPRLNASSRTPSLKFGSSPLAGSSPRTPQLRFRNRRRRPSLILAGDLYTEEGIDRNYRPNHPVPKESLPPRAPGRYGAILASIEKFTPAPDNILMIDRLDNDKDNISDTRNVSDNSLSIHGSARSHSGSSHANTHHSLINTGSANILVEIPTKRRLVKVIGSRATSKTVKGYLVRWSDSVEEWVRPWDYQIPPMMLQNFNMALQSAYTSKDKPKEELSFLQDVRGNFLRKSISGTGWKFTARASNGRYSIPRKAHALELNGPPMTSPLSFLDTTEDHLWIDVLVKPITTEEITDEAPSMPLPEEDETHVAAEENPTDSSSGNHDTMDTDSCENSDKINRDNPSNSLSDSDSDAEDSSPCPVQYYSATSHGNFLSPTQTRHGSMHFDTPVLLGPIHPTLANQPPAVIAKLQSSIIRAKYIAPGREPLPKKNVKAPRPYSKSQPSANAKSNSHLPNQEKDIPRKNFFTFFANIFD